MYETRLTEREDLDQLELSSVQNAIEPGAMEFARANWEAIEGLSYTWIVDGKIAAIAGIMPYSAGTGTAWALYGAAALLRPKTLIREVRNSLGDLMKRHGMHRVQTVCPVKGSKYRKMNELLGFEVEGVMRSYPEPGQDTYLMARIN